jgi:hypothetical protein
MKTKNVIAAFIIAVFTFAASGAFAQEQPAIRIYSTGDNLKLVFGYDSKVPVTVDFSDNEGIFGSDRVSQTKFTGGFIRRYKLNLTNMNSFWVDVKSNEVSARYKLTSAGNGKWTSMLETVTYNNPVAMR